MVVLGGIAWVSIPGLPGGVLIQGHLFALKARLCDRRVPDDLRKVPVGVIGIGFCRLGLTKPECSGRPAKCGFPFLMERRVFLFVVVYVGLSEN